MEKLIQIRGSKSGTHHGETVDVVLFEDGILGVYKREDNGKFELRLIERNDFNQRAFDNFMVSKTAYKASVLTHIWREEDVSEPEFMPDRYYHDIRTMYDSHYRYKAAKKKSVYKMVEEFMEKLEKDSYIEKYHSF